MKPKYAWIARNKGCGYDDAGEPDGYFVGEEIENEPDNYVFSSGRRNTLSAAVHEDCCNGEACHCIAWSAGNGLHQEVPAWLFGPFLAEEVRLRPGKGPVLVEVPRITVAVWKRPT